MKKSTFLFSIITAITLLMFPELDARGGGLGGGGHGGGGRGGGGRSVQRSPSMSRTSQSRPNRPSRSPQQRSNDHQTARSPQAQRPVNKARDADHLRNYAQNREGGKAPIPDNLKRDVERSHGDRQNIGNKVRQDIGKNRPHRNDWFRHDFWDHHHHFPPYYHYHNNWWGWATAAGIGGWLGWNAAPIYYDYYVDNGSNYWGPSNIVVVQPGAAEPTQPISAVAPEEEEDEWLPLGVFAVHKEGIAIADTNIYLQIALNKNGEISGTYYNATTDQGYEIEGVVDQDTQIANLKVVDDPDSPVIETGIYNLTKSEAPVRFHFKDGRVVNMILVRLDEPKDLNP